MKPIYVDSFGRFDINGIMHRFKSGRHRFRTDNHRFITDNQNLFFLLGNMRIVFGVIECGQSC